jgi:hypothetical protein
MTGTMSRRQGCRRRAGRWRKPEAGTGPDERKPVTKPRRVFLDRNQLQARPRTPAPMIISTLRKGQRGAGDSVGYPQATWQSPCRWLRPCSLWRRILSPTTRISRSDGIAGPDGVDGVVEKGSFTARGHPAAEPSTMPQSESSRPICGGGRDCGLGGLPGVAGRIIYHGDQRARGWWVVNEFQLLIVHLSL